MQYNSYEEFSEFELEQLNMKTDSDEKFVECGAVGTAEEELGVKSVVKKYKGVEAKRRTKGTGAGTLKLSLHMSYDRYNQIFGMKSDSLAEGVATYGQGSSHEVFALTALVVDEDGDKKLKAYPKCTITNAPNRKIENGGEEVAEIEIEIAIMPDKYGNAMYEALYDKVSSDIKSKWMEEFTPDLVQAPSA